MGREKEVFMFSFFHLQPKRVMRSMYNCVLEQPTQGNPEEEEERMSITPGKSTRIDNARKTSGHSGQLDSIYMLPAPVLHSVN